jgi:hypothetical protein
VSVQDRCMFCSECTVGSEIVLDASDGTPSLKGSRGSSIRSVLEIVQILMQDRCTVCFECTIGSEIILDAPDGTPR